SSCSYRRGKRRRGRRAAPLWGRTALKTLSFFNRLNPKHPKKREERIFTVDTARTFTFILKTPPASILLLRAAGIVKGSAEPNRNKVGKVTKKQVEEIAKTKLVDLNTTNLEPAG